MSFGQSIKHVFSNYATFQGRASRSEFWWWQLFTTIVGLILALPAWSYYADLINASSNQMGEMATVPSPSGLTTFFLILGTVWSLAILIPTIAVSARRLHDTDKSGWWLLLYFLSCCFGIGFIILIIFWVLPSTPGPNRFGLGPATA